jgi:hypothetical protein
MHIQGISAFLLAFVVIVTNPSLAQQSGSQISGRVVDATGSPVPGKRLELRQRGSPERIVLITDESGAFTYRRLSPGQYRVELVIEDRVGSLPDDASHPWALGVHDELRT